MFSVSKEELLKREPGIRGLIAATRGNHGQSVALAAQRKKLECVIVVPHGNSVAKNAAMRAQGAKLVEHGLRNSCGIDACQHGQIFEQRVDHGAECTRSQ